MDNLISEVKLKPNRSIIKLTGRLTAANAGTVKKYIGEISEKGITEIIFDLSGITFLDSSGLATFVFALKSTREAGGWLKLAALEKIPGKIFSVTMLDKVLDMYPDLEAALQSAEE